MKILSIIVQFIFITAIVSLAVYMLYDVITFYFEEQHGINIKKTKDDKKHLDNGSEDCNCCADGGCDCDNVGLPQEAK